MDERFCHRHSSGSLVFRRQTRGFITESLAAFQAIEAGNGFIYVPAVVLWEAAILERKGKIKLHGGLS